MGISQYGWFTRENPVEVDDLGGAPIDGNPICGMAMTGRFVRDEAIDPLCQDLSISERTPGWVTQPSFR